jgi:hypothetical protein
MLAWEVACNLSMLLLLLLLLLQGLYMPLPVPEQLRYVEGRDDATFDFLERELRFAV